MLTNFISQRLSRTDNHILCGLRLKNLKKGRMSMVFMDDMKISQSRLCNSLPLFAASENLVRLQLLLGVSIVFDDLK